MGQAGDKKTILLIEDDQDLALSLAIYFKGHGYHVLAAYDATFGIMSTHQSNIDLIILDIMLPGGGGVFVLDNLKKSVKTFDIPIIVMTAKIEPGLEQKCREKGCREFFTKPCDTDKLLEAVKKIIG